MPMCAHALAGDTWATRSAESGHSKDGSSKADGWWWVVIPPGFLTVGALQYKARDLYIGIAQEEVPFLGLP